MIEPGQIRALVELLREWGYKITDADAKDLVAEYDQRTDLQENRIGKFSRESLVARQAALRIKPRTGTQRREIYEFIKRHPEGVYREQVARVLDLPENSVRPRVVELIEGGWIKDSGATARNARGEQVELLVVIQ